MWEFHNEWSIHVEYSRLHILLTGHLTKNILYLNNQAMSQFPWIRWRWLDGLCAWLVTYCQQMSVHNEISFWASYVGNMCLFTLKNLYIVAHNVWLKWWVVGVGIWEVPSSHTHGDKKRKKLLPIKKRIWMFSSHPRTQNCFSFLFYGIISIDSCRIFGVAKTLLPSFNSKILLSFRYIIVEILVLVSYNSDLWWMDVCWVSIYP